LRIIINFSKVFYDKLDHIINCSFCWRLCWYWRTHSVETHYLFLISIGYVPVRH